MDGQFDGVALRAVLDCDVGLCFIGICETSLLREIEDALTVAHLRDARHGVLALEGVLITGVHLVLHEDQFLSHLLVLRLVLLHHILQVCDHLLLTLNLILDLDHLLPEISQLLLPRVYGLPQYIVLISLLVALSSQHPRLSFERFYLFVVQGFGVIEFLLMKFLG